ncbi:MAG: carbamate kinase [Deltaproteobacteria bacterium]|nr:carbamate kinase [Deltaproteobacteria bacterium]
MGGATGRKVIISIGGNAIVRRNSGGGVEEQFENVAGAAAAIARLATGGTSVIITHGNGPIVGNIVLRNEAARNVVPPMPLYICDADSEGGVGFLIQQTIYNQLNRLHGIKDVVTVVTQVVVDPEDPAFLNPTKPIGPFYTEEEARRLGADKGWAMREDSNRGWRRAVPSPRPVRVVEAGVIKRLAEAGVIVIAAGGGGVPVTEGKDGNLRGVDAVIDKDLATALLARETGAGVFVNLTQVEMVYEAFGKPGQRGLTGLTVAEAQRLLDAGEFAPGSMGPKIEAAVEFIKAGGKEVVITTPDLMQAALEGRAGTRIAG